MDKSIKIGKRKLIYIRWLKSVEAYGILTKKLNLTIQTLPKNMVFDGKNKVKIIE